MSWTAIAVLAAGSYAFKAIGLVLVGPLVARSSDDAPGKSGPSGGWPIQLGQLLPPALLAALVVNQTVTDGQALIVDARLAGVVAGAIAVVRGAPFWLVLVVAAGVTALLRLVTG